MLVSLEIRDILIIEALELEFQPGLNVLTGETGAGKSILLDSLGFVLGWRGRADLVRKGAETGEVTAVFHLGPDHPARAILDRAGFLVQDELILRRTNTVAGRKTARINDRRASGEVLRQLSDCLVELHGQQDDRGLLNPTTHRKILDDFGGLQDSVDQVRWAWKLWADCRAQLETATQALQQARQDEAFLRHAVDELETLAPEPGEEAALDTRRRLMQAAARIREDIARAHGALGPEGAEGTMGDARRWLEDAAQAAEGRLNAPLDALARALTELGEAQQGVEECLRDLSFDSDELEQVEERLFAMRALARKHDCLADELADFTVELRARLDALEAGDADLHALSEATKQAETAYGKLAKQLTKQRGDAAQALDQAMAGELAPLKMERAVFTTALDQADAGPDGVDQVVFTVATNPGAPAGPLNRIASGGELSRFLLALKVCLSGGETGLTMIFDEIDRGVGGATADAVGRRLAQIAQGQQVLVVTHSPQVAARGQHHWRVEKTIQGGASRTGVVALNSSAREDELARMLSGDTVTEEARAAARVLLEG